MLNLRDEVNKGIEVQYRSLAGEPLVDILERYFGNDARVWLDAVAFIPSDRISDVHDFVSRASRCDNWNNCYYIDFYGSIDELIHLAGLDEIFAVNVYHEYIGAYSQYEDKARIYFDIIEYFGLKRNDRGEAIEWISRAISDLEELDWRCASFAPSRLFPNYPLDHISDLSDLGHAMFSDGDLRGALSVWISILETNKERVSQSILHAVFERAERCSKNDLEFLIDDYRVRAG